MSIPNIRNEPVVMATRQTTKTSLQKRTMKI